MICIRFSNERTDDTVIFTNKMNLRNILQVLPGIGRVKRVIEWTDLVMTGPCGVVEIAGNRDKLTHIITSRCPQSGNTTATGITN